jgi:hypothetical protein
MQRGLAADAVLSVSAAAAPTFVAAALCPGALFGFLLGDRLLAVFHRVVSDDASAAGTAGENQCILLVKRAGAARYEPLAAGAVPGRGDEVLGVRWHPLCEIRGAP